MSVLRPITPADHDAVLAWNAAHVELLSPLDEDRLDALLDWCDLGCVITTDGRDGGFVFNSIHNVQARTPAENIVAMLQAVAEFNGCAAGAIHA